MSAEALKLAQDVLRYMTPYPTFDDYVRTLKDSGRKREARFALSQRSKGRVISAPILGAFSKPYEA